MRAVLAAGLALAVLSAQAWADGPYTDSPTSQWFRDLQSPYTLRCCDQADCRQVESEYRDGAWWALSAQTHTWVRIAPEQITTTVSIFTNAVLCEGGPVYDSATATYVPRVYCFAPPPIGF